MSDVNKQLLARDVLMSAMMEVCAWIDANDPWPDLNKIADRYANHLPAVAVPDDWRDAAHAAVIGLGAVRTSIERGETDKALARVNEVRAMLVAAQKGDV